MLSTCRQLFLPSVVQLIPNHLNWVEVGWLWKPGHLMQHHHSPSWSKSPYTAWMCVLGHCSLEKHVILPKRSKQKGWHIAAECCGSQVIKCSLNYKYITGSVTSITPPHHHTSSSVLHGGNHTCRDHPFTYSASKRHGGWNQKSHIWTHQTKGQISTGIMSIAHVTWPKQVSSY